MGIQPNRPLHVSVRFAGVMGVAIAGLIMVLLGPRAGVAVGYPPPGATPTVSFPQDTYFVYLPLVMKPPVPEYDIPPCRWPHQTGHLLGIAYNWGNYLQTPGTPWRIAFGAAVSDWSTQQTKVYFYQSNSGTVILNTYDQVGGPAGYAQPYCQGTTTVGYDAVGNLEGDYNGQTDNQRHAEAGHETGHSQGLGHIEGYAGIALLGYNPDNNVYYVPQQLDVSLVNQVYP